MTHLILDGRDIDSWQKHHSGGLLIPADKRPTVQHGDRATTRKHYRTKAARLRPVR